MLSVSYCWVVGELLVSCWWVISELLASCWWVTVNCWWVIGELLVSCWWVTVNCWCSTVSCQSASELLVHVQADVGCQLLVDYSILLIGSWPPKMVTKKSFIDHWLYINVVAMDQPSLKTPTWASSASTTAGAWKENHPSVTGENKQH